MQSQNEQPNLAIQLTAPGIGGIAVVRLVGPSVARFLREHFSREARAGRAVHGELHDEDGVIDDPVVVVSEDRRIADLNLHGGDWLVRATLELARRAGFTIVDGTIVPLHPCAVDAATEIQSEMLRYLPGARTELALRALLAQPKAWETFDPAHCDIEQVLADWSLHWLLHPPRVVIIGAPNVGKSTLANQLFAQERSITANLPGTTRDWVGEYANLDGLAVMLVDTPGQRQTSDPIEAEAIARSRNQIGAADLLILVLDVSQPLEPEQLCLLERYPESVRVINKIDLPSTWRGITPCGIPVLATAGEGIDRLRVTIRRHFGIEGMEMDRIRCWTRRQRDLLHSLLRGQKMR